MSSNATRIGLVTGVLATLIGVAVADPAGGTTGVSPVEIDRAASRREMSETIAPPPATFEGGAANVTEHLGKQPPLDATFTTTEGKHVTLREVLSGDLPTILTFNYADCPMLCSQQLNGLTAAMPAALKRAPVAGADRELGFALGEHYRIVTISLEPNASIVDLGKMRARYLQRVAQLQSETDPETAAKRAAGWTFLTGDAAEVQRVADAVGFGYKYLPDVDQWAHPAVLIFLSSAGVITRYVYGIEPELGVLPESIYKAGLAEPATATGFMLRCYHWDPAAKDHSQSGVMALRIGAASAVALLAAFGVFQFIHRRRKTGEVT